MKNISRFLLSLACVAFPCLVSAAESEEPIISFHTSIFDTYGAANSFHITLGATEETYIDIDYGYGPTEELIKAAAFDADAGGMTGTSISITVSKAGNVKIYGDASKIDYIDMEGCYITDLSFPTLTNVEILNLKHNELRGLDLSPLTKLMAVYLDDNPFSKETPLVLGPKPNLGILSMNIIDWLTPDFDMTMYPNLRSFSAFDCPTLTRLDPSKCPGLLQLSIDGSNVSQLDVSKNESLLILNITQTRITEIDLSHNPYLTEFYAQHVGAYNQQYKLSSIDLSHNPELVRLYVDGNNLTELDLSNNSKVVSFGCSRNHLRGVSFDNIPNMTLVDISRNNMDFNTMPVPRASFTEYTYQQYDLPVARSYKVGDVIDFTDRVIRKDGSRTDAVIFAYSKEKADEPYILDDEYFSFDNGKMTLNKACPDSVYIAYHNSVFPEYDLRTTPFKIKTAEEYGKPSAAIKYRTPASVKEYSFGIGFAGATPENPVTFYVDFGKGELMPFTATTSTIPQTPNVTGTRVGIEGVIYAAENTDLTAFGIEDVKLSRLDVTAADALAYIKVKNCNLSAIDLDWNRYLNDINFSGNNLTSVKIDNRNSAYIKSFMKNINFANNKISEFVYEPYSLINLDLSNNQLTAFDLYHATNLVNFNLANNLVEELNLQDCESLRTLDVSGNLLSAIAVPDYTPLQKLNIAGNRIPLNGIPAHGSFADYCYAPQRVVEISKKAPSINLSNQYVKQGGKETKFVWKRSSDNSEITDGIVETDKGRFRFADSSLGLIYCEMSHEAYPDFKEENIVRTSEVMTAEPPKNAFATVTPARDCTVSMSLAVCDTDNNEKTDPDVEIYVDWIGNGDMEQYVLHQNYTAFTASAFKDTQARFYTYDDKNNIRVFSISAPLKQIDCTQLNDCSAFFIYGFTGNTADMNIPVGEQLNELGLQECGLTTIDFENTPNLTLLNLNNNSLQNLDVSTLKNLGCLYASNNPGLKVKIDNPRLWEIALMDCELTSLDLSKAPAAQQVWLSNNSLKSIDVEGLNNLKVFTIDNNEFDILTLPLPKETYYLYNYSNQKPVEAVHEYGRVDLSRYAERDGVKTKYQWFIDTPYFDESGNLYGEDLYEDEEYRMENGVTHFLKPFDNVMCVMTNDLFPKLYQYTQLMNVVSGIDEVIMNIDTDKDVEYFNLQGVRVSNPSDGIYIRRQGDRTSKVMVK